LGIIQRQAFQNTIINYIGVFFGFLNVVVLFPLFLSEDEFGLTRLVLSLATIMAQLASFGVPRIAIKFFPVFRTENSKNNGLLKIMLWLSSIGFGIVILIYLGFKTTILHYYEDDSKLFLDYYYWIPMATIGLLLFIVFESFLQALRKTVFTNLLRNVIIRIYWLIILAFYWQGHISFFNFMIWYMMGYFLTSFLCIIQLMNLKEFSLDSNPKFNSKRMIKPLFNYGLYSLLSGTTLILVVNIDLLMIGALLPTDKLTNIGIYAIATYIVSIIYIPTNSLSRISAPIVASDWRHRNLSKIDLLYKKSSVILLFLGGLIFGCIALNIDDLLGFLKPEYRQAKEIILLLGLARLFDMASGLNLVIITVTKFYRAETLLAILLLILVSITNYLLIPIYGIFGAALGTTVVFITFNILVFIFILVKLNMQPYTLKTLYVALLGVAAGLIVYLLPLQINNPLIAIIIKSIAFSTLYLLPVYLFKIAPDINSLLDKMIINRLMKKSSDI
jgi:O-antigen/teichoic acid export membrane protein